MAAPDAGDAGGVTLIQVNDDAIPDEIAPLLATEAPGDKPQRMTIFSVSYPRKRPAREAALGANEAELLLPSQIFFWAWRGSRYSGLLCVAFSSIIYWIMEVFMDIFPARSIPSFETVFTRCTIIIVLSFLWLRRTGQPLSIPTHIRSLLVMRSLTGFISMLSFIYSVQNLPLPHAIMLNFATPLMASIGAKFILQEKVTFSNIGGLLCSFLGLLFIFRPMLIRRGDVSEVVEMSNTSTAGGNHPTYAILVGIFSSILGGVSCCLIQAGAKASDQPVYTVLAFGLLACPVSAICTFTLQEFVLPSLFTFFLMVFLGVLAFFAEITLARGLQLEKISKAVNMLYIKVVLSQAWGMAFLGTDASPGKLIGFLLITASVCSTMYFGPEKEIEYS